MMAREKNITDAEALSRVISILGDFDEKDRNRILETAARFYGINSIEASVSVPRPQKITTSQPRPHQVAFSEDKDISPKEFLFEKRPQTDIDRITCLAYYLTHYRGVLHFKTVELSKLNTEAAQRKLSNAALTANNALQKGFLAQAPKNGYKQLSAIGEQFVRALPDHAKAKAVSQANKSRKSPRRKKKRTPKKAKKA